MKYNEAFEKYAATHWTDRDGNRWFISGVGSDQLYGNNGSVTFQAHPVNDKDEIDYATQRLITQDHLRMWKRLRHQQ